MPLVCGRPPLQSCCMLTLLAWQLQWRIQLKITSLQISSGCSSSTASTATMSVLEEDVAMAAPFIQMLLFLRSTFIRDYIRGWNSTKTALRRQRTHSDVKGDKTKKPCSLVHTWTLNSITEHLHPGRRFLMCCWQKVKTYRTFLRFSLKAGVFTTSRVGDKQEKNQRSQTGN